MKIQVLIELALFFLIDIQNLCYATETIFQRRHIKLLDLELFIEYAIGEMHVLLTYNDPRAAYQSLWGS